VENIDIEQSTIVKIEIRMADFSTTIAAEKYPPAFKNIDKN